MSDQINLDDFLAGVERIAQPSGTTYLHEGQVIAALGAILTENEGLKARVKELSRERSALDLAAKSHAEEILAAQAALEFEQRRSARLEQALPYACLSMERAKDALAAIEVARKKVKAVIAAPRDAEIEAIIKRFFMGEEESGDG